MSVHLVGVGSEHGGNQVSPVNPLLKRLRGVGAWGSPVLSDDPGGR
jgi:hypothetical protein